MKKTKKDQKVQHADEVAVTIRMHQQDSLHHIPQVKQARTRNGPLLSRRLSIAAESSPNVASVSSVSTITKNSTIASAQHPKEKIIVDCDNAELFKKREPKWVQTSVSKTAPVNSDLKEKTDIAIAHLIHARCLPFDVSGDALFSKMCTLIQATNGTYVPPNRHQVSGHLLDSLYKAHMKTTEASLITDSELYGLTAYGDGATIVRVPLLNILVGGVHEPQGLLDIVDCTGHMAEGGTKNATYVAHQFLPFMRKLDPQKNRFDCVAFDGARNVQLAGELIEKHFPMVTTVHGAEHSATLFFDDVFTRCAPLKLLCNFSNRVSTLFSHLSLAEFKTICLPTSSILLLWYIPDSYYVWEYSSCPKCSI